MINYKGTPLFGQDSSVSHTSEFFAIAGTVLFWLLFLIFSFVIKPLPKKPEYKEVQIVLSSTPVVQKSEEAPAPAEAASASEASVQSEPAQPQPVVETPAPKAEPAPVKETPKPKAQAQPKKEPAKTQSQQKPAAAQTTAPPQKTETVYAKSVEELMAEQFSSKSSENKMKDFDKWFDDDESEESQATDQVNKVQNDAPAFSGSAGTAAQNSSQGISSKSSEDFYNKAASEDTEATLKNIQNTNQNGNSPTNKGDAPTSDRSNKDSMKWIKGNVRKPLNSLNRNLSSIDEMKNQITNETPFTITFSVDSNGHVIRSSIVISNVAMLTPNVKNEMIEHIIWLEFTSGEGIASAEFIWNLAPQ